ncbi:hypothetical protein [Mesorhizobium sp.]|uniref:hypothetical protein n=1 Tax=Mesorhizobium sp. TaxID=1871066 RepID=UPI0025BE436E|nr:hypothetical protein [Mesorhizobium sp.]
MRFGLKILGSMAAAAAASSAVAAPPVDKAYIRSLATPGKTVLVVEYYDGQSRVVDRKGYASSNGYKAASATEIRVDQKLSLRLFGIEPCAGDMVNRKENYTGTCSDFARHGLMTLLQSPRVILCRAFLAEQQAQVQDATCYGYYNFPGSLDSVDMFEEQLVSLGSHRIARKTDGSPARPDLMEAEKIGRSGYGMWADPRIKGQ